MDVLQAMRAFVMVAREGSFTAAAKANGQSVQLVSKYVRQLEEHLQVPLFDRTTRVVQLNDTGKAYLEPCVGLLEQFDETEAAVRLAHGQLQGRIRISAPTAFGSLHLSPALAAFIENHPAIELDLQLSDRKVAIVDEGFDLAIRIGNLPDSTLIARRLANMRMVVCVAPKYLSAHGKPEHPQALSQHRCIIDSNLRDEHHWPFIENGEEFRVSVSGPVHANAPLAARQMALAGLGIALCPMYVIAKDVLRGDLHILFSDNEALNYGVYALYTHRRHLSARVRALVEHLAQQFAQLG